MNDKIMEQYLEAFYAATATPQEVQALTDFFADESRLTPRWREERKVFLLIRDASETPLPKGIDKRLEKQLDRHIAKQKRYVIGRRGYQIAGIAAACLLCLSIAVNYYISPVKEMPLATDTYKDPHEAAQVAGEALTFLSSNLNKGMEQVEEAQKEIEQVNRILNKQLK